MLTGTNLRGAHTLKSRPGATACQAPRASAPAAPAAGARLPIDDTRIRESLPTINYLREQGAKTILMAHFGRPKGNPVEKYSLRPVADYLHTLINQPVIFSHDTIGEVPEKIVAHMQEGDVALLQNLRFHPGEEANDPKFAEALAKLGDLYVNDAFGAAHRAHASTAGITTFVSKSAMGLLMELLGLWLTLGARIQLGFFSSTPEAGGPKALVRKVPAATMALLCLMLRR